MRYPLLFVTFDHIHVRFDLDPPHGVGALRIGMTRKEARKALETLGQCRPFARYKSPPGWLLDRGRAGNGTTAIFAYCDEAGQIDAIEFGTPGFGTPAEDEIVYHDIDVFRSPASDVVEAILRLGEHLEEKETASSFVAPNVFLALWRDGGPEGPDGRPLYFEAALIARPGYDKDVTAVG